MDEHRAGPPAAPDPRPVLAALGNLHVRRVYAEVVLGAAPDEVGRDLGAARRRRAVSTPPAAGPVEGVHPAARRRAGGPDARSRALPRPPRAAPGLPPGGRGPPRPPAPRRRARGR